MRKINGPQVLVFVLAMVLALALALATNALALGALPLGDFRGVAQTLGGVLFVYVYAIALYRGLLHAVPLPVGEIEPGSRAEFVWNVYVLFFLLLFFPVMRSGIMPVPIMRLFYLALGARMGDNTYSSGIIFDPAFVELGANCIVGQSAQIIPHAIEGQRLAIYRITMGDEVTIGANAIIMADVIIGNRSVVAAGAVVPKGTRIGEGEFWGGIPAQRIK